MSISLLTSQIGFDNTGISTHLVRSAVGNHLAVIQHHDPLADTHDQRHIMLDEQDGDAELLPDKGNGLHEFPGFGIVHARCRFVQAEELGVGRQCPGNLQLALLSVGQVARPHVRLLIQIKDSEQFQRPAVGVFLLQPEPPGLAHRLQKVVVHAVMHGCLDIVQHCHIENPISFAYMEKGRIVVVTSTQIPHIVRRVIGQALGIPWGRVRVIKPYIGGGFGNKQDVLYEPLNAFLTTQVGGRPVKLEVSREETFCNTRTRHSIEYDLTAGVDKEGHLLAKDMKAYSSQGAYASHGHAIAANGLTAWRLQYACPNTRGEAYTIYTNTPTAGAMRAYGIPQAAFAIECLMDDVAAEIHMDPLEFRRKNLIQGYYEDAYLKPIAANTNGIFQCLEKGAEYIHWDEKRKEYADQTGSVRRGVGMSLFSYKTGVWPISLEIAGARLSMNQDGSVQLQIGATEIGQGADTVFSQMAAETLHMDVENVHIVTVQDTDVTPFDTGAYASRQSFVTGTAVKQCAEQLLQKILDYAKTLLPEQETRELSLDHGWIYAGEEQVLSLEALAQEAYYSLSNSSVLTAEVSTQVKKNTIATGCCFAEVEVDMKLGTIQILNIINVHDSGKLLNPQLAQMQVHGGMSMGMGYGLSEQLVLDEKTGRPLNGNLLDYKLMTALDTPDIKADFVELDDPMGPYGNKALGEPPAIPGAPAIRNAVLHATGVAFNEIPLTPQRLIEGFKKAGLI